MKLINPISLEYLLQNYNLILVEDRYNDNIYGINEINKVEKGDITFVDTTKYYSKVLNSNASVIIINSMENCPYDKCILYSPNPFDVYNKIAKDFATTTPSLTPISENSKIGLNTILYPNVYIGNNVKIGDNCIIHPNTTIYDNTIIGNNVIIQSNTSIGSHAFYYNNQKGNYIKMVTIGKVIIEDNVEIGSNTSVDAGVSGDTIIGKGTKIDNHVHIAHGVEIGKNCLLCAQVAIAGKSIIGDNCILYGKVAVTKGVKIGNNSHILATSNVGKDLIGNNRYFGSPAIEARKAMKEIAFIKNINKYIEKIKEIS